MPVFVNVNIRMNDTHLPRLSWVSCAGIIDDKLVDTLSSKTEHSGSLISLSQPMLTCLFLTGSLSSCTTLFRGQGTGRKGLIFSILK